MAPEQTLANRIDVIMIVSDGSSTLIDAKTRWSHRILAFANGDSDDRFASVSNFIIMLCFHAGCRQILLGFRMDEVAFQVSGVIALGVAAGCLLEKRSGSLRYALPFIALSTAIFTYSKPVLGNHAAMEALLLLAVAISVPVTNARAQTINGLFRWSCIILFLNSGLQKIFYGAYFNGSFLARRIGTDRFGWLLELFLPRDEYLQILHADGASPMVLSSVTGLLLSNAAYLSEIGCAVLLIIPKTRSFGLVVSILTVIGIEVIAREAGFGLMFIMMLLLFRPRLLESRAILLFPVAAYIAFGLTEIWAPGVLYW